ncbi:MAG: RecQ family ATP-dependent DNA helicase [Flavisolibacter sp.]
MEDLRGILKANWGYDAFRPHQEEIIRSVLSGKDTLATLPTGGGKSICFQVPALAREGICMVISPLVALMNDQVENLKKRSIPALLIHSGMPRADVIQTLRNATHSYFKFLYISPERLETSLFKEYLPSFDVNLIAVDEAHCISQWGYDFRPSYLRITELRKELPGVPVMALTASATLAVEKDICEKLTPAGSPSEGPGQWQVFRPSFERKNLSYSVFEVGAKMPKICHILKKVPGTAIVYCKSRKRTEAIAGALQAAGIPATAYHAGLGNEERSKRQEDWIHDRTRVMVCTNAFGMGIDKAGVRAVIHVDPPDGLENYYQEAGRAGRDGNKAYAVLLYEAKDLQRMSVLHLTRYPTLDQIKSVYQALVNFLQIPVHTGRDRSFTFHFEAFVQHFQLPASMAFHALKALDIDGWLDLQERNFAPSTIVFTTGKKGLYEFEKSYPEQEPLLTTLLRTYEGIFDMPVFISEKQLAWLMKEEEAVIRRQLKSLSSFGILRYLPQHTEPQLIFRRDRVKAEDLMFHLGPYEKRKEVFIHRVQAMTDYIGTASCRSRFIAQYFGDPAAGDCGVCDNCLEKRRAPGEE